MPISEKQKKILAFPYSAYRAIICDGAVRSGKTSIMTVAFIDWAMREFSGQRFGICGKTVDSATKNIVVPYLSMSYAQERYSMRWRRADKLLEVKRGAVVNCFEVFGGKDESSFMLIQGRTLAGVLLDEVTLMPESFVNQALARCSVDGARLWFSCNPQNPNHWFYREWIRKHTERNALYLHFAMTDNPGLSADTLKLYETMYSGVFYERYVLGRWVMSEGVIYDMFSRVENVYKRDDEPRGLKYSAARYIGVDYGTVNDTVFLEAFDDGENLWISREYRWESREKKRQKTDREYADDFMAFHGDDPALVCPAVVDPSAASFIEELRRRGVYVREADNDVLDGIRRVSTMMGRRKLKICEACAGTLRELEGYIWDEKAALSGVERPVKLNDHGVDALRYLVNTIVPRWRLGEEI